MQIKHYTHYTRFRFRKHFLSITSVVQYLNQKAENDTPINHFFPENTQDNKHKYF